MDSHNERVMTIQPEASLHSHIGLEFILEPRSGTCSRCKKVFEQEEERFYKLCPHCRELQRQRSKRWQLRTKEKVGVCTRCGTNIPEDQNQFVLCPNCRISLRSKKVSRGLLSKCIHCASALDADCKFKVCDRCRDNDRSRRRNLELNGFCVRCAKSLLNEAGKSKICEMCKDRRNNPNLMPNARIPNILNAAYKQEYLRQERKNDGKDEDEDKDEHDDDEVLSAANLMIPNYTSHNYDSHLNNVNVTATLALVLTLTEDNSLLEGEYFSVDKN